MPILKYNPFIKLSDGLLEHLIRSGRLYFIIQRFNWPGLKPGSAFLASDYADRSEAKAHEAELRDKEGRLLDLQQEDVIETVRKLLKPSSGFQVYYNGTIDKKNEKKLKDAYVNRVYNYIQSIGLKKEDNGYDVYIRVVNGRVMADITTGDKCHSVLFYNIIK